MYYIEHMTTSTLDLDAELTVKDIKNYAQFYSNQKPKTFKEAVRLLNNCGWKVYKEVRYE